MPHDWSFSLLIETSSHLLMQQLEHGSHGSTTLALMISHLVSGISQQKRLLPWLSEDLATTWGFCPVLERWFSYVFFTIIQDFWGLKMVPRHSPTQFQLDPLKKHQLTFISISTLSSSKLFLKKITSKTFLQIASSKPDCSKLFGSFEGLISS